MTTDITDRLRQEFRVRDRWVGMDEFDSARGETVPHPLANEAATEIETLLSKIDRLESLVARLLMVEVRGAPRNMNFTPEDGELVEALYVDGKLEAV